MHAIKTRGIIYLLRPGPPNSQDRPYLAILRYFNFCGRFSSTSSWNRSNNLVPRRKEGHSDLDGDINRTTRQGANTMHLKSYPRVPWEIHCEFARVVKVIRNNGEHMESDLNRLNLELSNALVGEVIRALSHHRTSALRFFMWILSSSNPGFSPSPEIHNQVVDNLGLVKDYASMLCVLKVLSARGHCLTEKAFNFLNCISSDSVENSITEVSRTLKKAGGSCCSSGIYSLIRLLCSLNMFELATYLIKETARRTSYPNALIAAKCRNGDFQGARDLLDEMSLNCNPTTTSYNYLLGSLFKNRRVAEGCELLKVMEELGYLPDSVTFEVVIFHACRINQIDVASKFMYKMLSDGIKPRLTTHAACIKSYFQSGRMVDAHKYVIDMSASDSCSANMNYSLLANLFWTSRRVTEAGDVLSEMMEKGLKPNFPVYMRVMKDLHKLGRGDLASNLKCKFSMFPSSAHTRRCPV